MHGNRPNCAQNPHQSDDKLGYMGCQVSDSSMVESQPMNSGVLEEIGLWKQSSEGWSDL